MNIKLMTNFSTKIKLFFKGKSNTNLFQIRSKTSPLEKDIVEISATSRRWQDVQKNYIPTCFEGSEIPSHHYISGYNSKIRNILKDINLISEIYELRIPNFIKLFWKKNFIEHFKEQLDKGIIQRRIKRICKIDKEFTQLPPLEKDCIVYRGRNKSKWSISPKNSDFHIIKKSKTGDIIIPDKAYSYCAFNRDFAQNWCLQNQFGCETIMYTIRIPKGAKVSRSFEHGGEIIMPRNAKYKIISKKKKHNHTEVVLEYLLPTKDNLAETEAIVKKFKIMLKKKKYIIFIFKNKYLQQIFLLL